ncbi:MAG: hypothetical protein KGH58_00295 [Candidatus Micrarchaeota archaeon]|nr:hypothetical protein [Candidatus Micrarchaeota archaeon]
MAVSGVERNNKGHVGQQGELAHIYVGAVQLIKPGGEGTRPHMPVPKSAMGLLRLGIGSQLMMRIDEQERIVLAPSYGEAKIVPFSWPGRYEGNMCHAILPKYIWQHVIISQTTSFNVIVGEDKLIFKPVEGANTVNSGAARCYAHNGLVNLHVLKEFVVAAGLAGVSKVQFAPTTNGFVMSNAKGFAVTVSISNASNPNVPIPKSIGLRCNREGTKFHAYFIEGNLIYSKKGPRNQSRFPTSQNH